MERAVERVAGFLSSLSRPTVGTDPLKVARTAARGDASIGSLVAAAFRKVGKDGVITIQESTQPETTLAFQEGLHFDRGYVSELFITDIEKQACILENCNLLIYEGSIGSMRDLLPLLEQVARSGRPLLVIAREVEGEALATLTVNKTKGTLACAAVGAPAQGDRRRAILEDIAIVTGGLAFTLDQGRGLAGIRLDELGRADKIVITKNATTIFGGAGSPEAIRDRVRSIRTQIEAAASSFDQEKLRERLATIVGSIGIIRLGGFTPLDILEQKYKAESSMWAVHSAMEEGWVPGGGLALLRASEELAAWPAQNEIDSASRLAVSRSLEKPIAQLIENAKRSSTQLLAELHKAPATFGFNVSNGKVEDLIEAGLIDSTKTLRLALRIAFSHVKAILQTGAWELGATIEPK